MNARLHHVAISTGDADRLADFYGGLGFAKVSDRGWRAGNPKADAITALRGSEARQVLLRAGNAYLELFEYSAPQPRPGDPDRPVNDHGITHLCLDVDDLDGLHERLAAAGTRFHCPPQDLGAGVRTTYARDPDGNIVELQELSTPHPFALD
jgi:catechol 2,3-dioxygenase-like lactoylglutathione lyase family enzyme